MTLLAYVLIAQSAPAQFPDVVPPVPLIVPGESKDLRGPIPLSNPAAWVTTMDYPIASLRTSEQGTAGFTVQVDTEGRVSSCKIKSSSGSPALDEATCSLVTRRARFRPASDIEGRPKEGEYSNRVRWVIPVANPPQPGLVTISYTVTAGGEVADCKVTLEGGVTTQALMFANFCKNGSKMKPYLDSGGQPVARKVIVTNTITVE